MTTQAKVRCNTLCYGNSRPNKKLIIFIHGINIFIYIIIIYPCSCLTTNTKYFVIHGEITASYFRVKILLYVHSLQHAGREKNYKLINSYGIFLQSALQNRAIVVVRPSLPTLPEINVQQLSVDKLCVNLKLHI